MRATVSSVRCNAVAVFALPGSSPSGDSYRVSDSKPTIDQQSLAFASEGAGQTARPVEHADPVPGRDWPTHGGYLGCLLGLLMSCIIAGFLGSTLFAAVRFYRMLPDPVAIALSVLTMFVVVVIFGRLGFVLGKRFLRYYPEAGKTWGQDDDYVHPVYAELEADREATTQSDEHAAQPLADSAEN